MKSDISFLVENNPRVKELKKQAKILLRETKKNINPNITLRACHDLVAQKNGYKSWYQFHTEIKKLYKFHEIDIKNYFYKTTPSQKKYFNYGYSKDMGMHYCLSNQNMLSHTLITGNNREKINIHFAKQAIEANETLVFLDASGQGNLYSEILTLAKKVNREDDIKVIDFTVNRKEYFYDENLNNFNPFSSGGADVLTELFISLIDNHNDDYDNIWKGRATSLISTVMIVLTYFRDRNEVLLDFEVIREYLIFNNLIKLYERRDELNLPSHIIYALKEYLFSIPGFQESAIKQHDNVIEQHGFLVMQFSKILGIFSDSYGHIFNFHNSKLGIEDFRSKLGNKNSIILVVFPCFKTSVNELKILPKLFFNSFKLHKLSYDLKENIKSTTWIINDCETPFSFLAVSVRDRYSNVRFFISSNETNIKNPNSSEAESLISNCNIKIDMKSATHYELEHQYKKYSLNI